MNSKEMIILYAFGLEGAVLCPSDGCLAASYRKKRGEEPPVFLMSKCNHIFMFLTSAKGLSYFFVCVP